MAAPLLQTKIYIPSARPKLVPRLRLIDQLDEGLHRKMTLISAPAGFGKTTLVSEWAQHLRLGAAQASQIQNRVAWLSLDESDNDPARFLAYLIAALQTIEADIANGALSALQSPQPPSEAILTTLINGIAALPHRVVLILDDCHLIEAQPIHDALTFLLRHLPRQMHLVVATRDDPLLPVARLRARGQLTELRAADLRFTSAEAAEFLNQVMGLALSARDVAALETRTEGWIVGLQLAAISMRGHVDVSGFIESFTGSHHFVLDYLVQEVLQQQSESVQAFLLHTSVLDRLTGSLCDAVRFGVSGSPTDQEDGRTTLEKLAHANLFIVPLDQEQRWYRYHQLFADLLRERLRRNPPPLSSPPLGQRPAGNEGGTEEGIVAELHRRASAWYERNGFVDEAIEHALRAEDVERAAHLIEEHVDAMWVRGEHTRLRRWLARLPVELVFSKPHLCIPHAWHLFTSGQQDAAEHSLHAAEVALDTGTDRAAGTSLAGHAQLSGSDRMKIRGRAAAIRAFLAFYRGDVQATDRYARQALECLPEEDLTWRSTAAVALGDAYSFAGELAAAHQARLDALEASRAAGNTYMALIASMKLAVTLRQQGRLAQVIEICQQYLQLASESGLSQTVVVGWLLAIWGEVLAERNDLDGALQHAVRGVELTERGRDLAMIGWSYLCLIRVLFSRGDMAGAGSVVRKIAKVAREHYVPPWITALVAAWQARLWLAQDDLDAASGWVQQRGLEAAAQPTYLHETEYLALARILIAQGRADETAGVLRRLLESAERGGHTSRAIEVLILQTLALQAQGATDRAIATLERALSLAEPGGYVRTFVDEGPPLAHLLHDAAARGIAPDYARRLLSAYPVGEPERSAPSGGQVPESELVEPLSERELEILQFIAEGLTNREIASRLFLSLNTVKAHTRNTYGKLGVHSRTSAVARARALGLLPST